MDAINVLKKTTYQIFRTRTQYLSSHYTKKRKADSTLKELKIFIS